MMVLLDPTVTDSILTAPPPISAAKRIANTIMQMLSRTYLKREKKSKFIQLNELNYTVENT